MTQERWMYALLAVFVFLIVTALMNHPTEDVGENTRHYIQEYAKHHVGHTRTGMIGL